MWSSIIKSLRWGWTGIKSGWKWGTVTSKISSPAAVSSFRWVWRAVDLASIGLVGYDLFADKSGDSESTAINKYAEDNLSGEILVDSILNAPVRTLLSISMADTDEDAMRVLYARAGAALFAGQGTVPHTTGLSLAMVGEYKSAFGDGYAYNVSDLMKYAEGITATATKELGSGADEIKSAFEEISKDASNTIGEVGRRNLDYLVWIFDLMSDGAIVQQISKPVVTGGPLQIKQPIAT